MRLLSGLFRVSGEAAARIPAACLDERLDIPSKGDYYSAASEGVVVTRIEGQREVTKPLSQALNDWLQISGNGTITSVTVAPRRREPNVRYEIKVTSDRPAVVAAKGEEVAALVPKLNLHKEALERVDAFGNSLRAVFGNDSGIVSKFDSQKSYVEWAIVASGNSQETSRIVRTFLSEAVDFLGVGADYTGQERLQRLTVLHGDLLSETQVAEAQRLLGVPVAAPRYDRAFSTAMSDFVGLRKQLSDVFGPDSDYAEEFRYRVSGEFLSSYDPRPLPEAVAEAKAALKDILLEDLGGLKPGEGARDVVSLFYGKQFTNQQAEFVGGLLGVTLGRPTSNLDNVLLLKTNPWSKEVVINTTSSSETLALGDLTVEKLRALTATHPRMVVAGHIGDGLAAKLSDSGVSVVRRYDELARNPVQSPKRMKLIIVGSEDQAVAAKIFGGQDVASVKRATATARRIPNSVVVENRQQYEAAVAGLKPDERGLTVFHDEGGGINLDDPVWIEEVADRTDGLSCNTYKYGNIGFPTTQELDFQITIDALSATMTQYADKPVVMDNFMATFRDNYVRESASKRLIRKALIVGGALGSAGVLYIVHAIATGLSEEPSTNEGASPTNGNTAGTGRAPEKRGPKAERVAQLRSPARARRWTW
jgi:hypothetical protein